VNARDVQRGIFSVRETLSVPGPGPLTLLYPEWLPGYHAPKAPLEFLAGLRLRRCGQVLHWQRDQVAVHAFHVDVPDGDGPLEIEFQLLCPTAKEQGEVGVSDRLLNLKWNSVLLYPAGYAARQIGVRPQVELPDAWEFACALELLQRNGPLVTFATAPLDVVVDSPLLAGKHCRRYALDPQVMLNVFADRPQQAEVGKQPIECLRKLVKQADRLFGARQFPNYQFLVAASDELSALGVEHHQCAEIVFAGDFFVDWQGTRSKNEILAHEYIHSWNGKFTRGHDSCTETFDQPIRSSLLWVYEGLTQYWGQVLSARSGWWNAQTLREALALTAARCANMAGRRWRPLEDTTRDPIIAARKTLPWESWQRNQDYYTDGQLIWLEVDALLRELTGEEKSLDDFARNFFGVPNKGHRTLPYDFEDLVTELAAIAAHDWKGFFTSRLKTLDPAAPLNGLAKSGYELVYRDEPSDFHRAADELEDMLDLTFSIGLSVKKTGKIKEVIWDSPAFHAGATAGVEIIAVNGRAFSLAELQEAVREAGEKGVVRLSVKKLQHLEEVEILYAGGHRYPHLVRREGTVGRLDDILAARA
jgi:predicted metalloprotease with PDZ domain